MTKLKKIYYPILAVVFVIALVLGFVASAVNFGAKADRTFIDKVRVHMEAMNMIHNSYESDNQDKLRNYIIGRDVENTLLGAGVLQSEKHTKSDNYADAEIDDPTYVVQEVVLNEDTYAHLSCDNEMHLVLRELTNIVVAIPGKNTDEAILFTANYDSAAKSQSGIENMQAAAMLQTIVDVTEDYYNNKIPERTLLFVFTDAEHEGALGAYAFRYQFKGFDGIVDKVKLAVNFGATGTGALAVSADGIALNEVKGISSGLNDAIDGIMDGVSDYDVYNDIARINVFFTGSKAYLNSSRDTVAAVKDSQISAIGGTMKSLVDAYGFGKVEGSNYGGSFYYPGLSISYGNTAPYVLGAIAIVLLILAVVEIIRNGKKASGVVRGVLSQLIALVATTVILYACYFVLTLLLAGFGVVPIRALVTVRYMNIGLFISCLLLAFAAYAGVFLLIRRIYKVKATEAARGGAILIMIAGIVMAFAMPKASLVFVLTSVLEGLALVITAELSKKFKNKHGADIERLFIYTIPLILLTPAMIPVLLLASYSLSAVYLPIVLAVAVLGFMVIAPYFGLLKSVFAKVAAKLPKHTIRVERIVTEQVEGAKKGRTQEVTHKKVINEKVEWEYRNRYGIAILSVLSAFLIIMFAVCPKYHFSTNIADTYAYSEAVKDNAIVYVWEQRNTDLAIEKLRVYDKVAYSFFGTIDNDYTWNQEIGAYEKDFLGDSYSLHGTSVPLSISLVGDDNHTLNFKTYNLASESYIEIKLTNVANATKLTIDTSKDKYEYENDGKDTIIITLPYDDNDFDSFSITFDFDNALNVGVEYYQYLMGESTTNKIYNSIIDYSKVAKDLSQKDYASDISCGMIFYKTITFTMGK